MSKGFFEKLPEEKGEKIDLHYVVYMNIIWMTITSIYLNSVSSITVTLTYHQFIYNVMKL